MSSKANQYLFYLLFILPALLFSCEENGNSEPDPVFPYLEEARKAITLELVTNDLESIVLNSIINLDIQDPGGTINTHRDSNIFAVRGNCARVINEQSNRIVLDIDACNDALGIERGGTMMVDYEDAFDEPGNIIEVELIGYQYENISISGNFTIRNTSVPDSEITHYEILFPRTQLIISGGSESFYFSGTRNLEVYEVLNSIRQNDFRSFVTGQLVIDEDFPIVSKHELRYRIDCWANGFYLPRAGIQEVSGNNFDFAIDYFSNGCSWDIKLSNGDIETENLTLQSLFDQ